MAAGVYDIVIEQGTLWSVGLLFRRGDGQPVNLTNFTAKSQIRNRIEDTVVAADITITFDQNRRSGKMTLSLSPAITKTLTFAKGSKGVYDLELIDPNGVPKRMLQGSVTLSPEVTR